VNYVRDFAPWTTYAVLSSFDLRLGTYLAAVAALLVLTDQLRTHSVDVLGSVSCSFFLVMAVILLADPHSGLDRWTWALANGVLAIMALASLAVRKPFTLSMARATVPERFWNTVPFIHANMVITSVWAAAFAASAIVSALIVEWGHSNLAALIVVQVLAVGIPLVYSDRYAKRAGVARARAAGLDQGA
jgi:hypothetical protein